MDPASYRFGRVALDVEGRALVRGERRIQLRPREFDLLLHLVHQRHRVVPKEQLVAAVWKGAAVSDAALFSCVKRARAALREVEGDAPDPPSTTIRSYYGHGYRFLSRPSPDDEPGAGRDDGTDDSIARDPAAPGAPIEATSGFVGRRALVQALSERLELAERGRGSVALLSGEAGIGKSRTALELARLARTRGFSVLTGRCQDGGEGQAFWPWTEMLRGQPDTALRESLRTVFDAEAAALRSLEGVRGRLPHGSDVALDAAVLRTRVLAEVIAALRRVAGAPRPLLLVLEDLQWADPSSLQLLTALVDQVDDVPILLLGTFRTPEVPTSHPLTPLRSRLSRAGARAVFDLDPLDALETRQLLESIVEEELSPEVAELVVRSGEGNPFFTGEIWYHLVEIGAVVNDDSRWVLRRDDETRVLSDGARLVVARRLARLTAPTRAVLATAAVLGREFHVEEIAGVGERDVESLVEAIDEADAANVVREVDPHGTYRFTHALIHAAVYQEVPTLRRLFLHRRIAERIAARGNPEDVTEAARHFLVSASLGPIEPVIEFAMSAAERDMGLLAYEEAVRWLERALEAIERHGQRSGPSDDRADGLLRVLLALGAAARLAGLGERADSAFARAAQIARGVGDGEALAAAALGLTTPWTYDDTGAAALLEDACAALERPASSLRVRVLGALAVSLYHDPASRDRVTVLGEEALSLARELGDPGLRMHALEDWLSSQWYSDNLEDQHRVAVELHDLAVASGRVREQGIARSWRTVIALVEGDIAAAREHARHVESTADKLRQPLLRWHAMRFRTCLSYMGGDLETAESMAASTFELGRQVSERGALLGYSGIMTSIRREQGRLDELLPMLEASSYSGDPYSNLHLTRPYLLAEAGRLDEARAALEEVAANGFAGLSPNSARNTFLFGLSALAESCAATMSGDAAMAIADRLYRLAGPLRHRWIVAGWGIVCLGPMEIVVGMLEGLLGRWEESQASFERAIAQATKQKASVATVVATYGHARASADRGRPEDRRRAAVLVESGLELARRHRLDGWTPKFERLAARLG